jgi:hypothetical protein
LRAQRDHRAHRAISASAAFSASASVVTGRPVSVSASVSFGVMKSHRPASHRPAPPPGRVQDRGDACRPAISSPPAGGEDRLFQLGDEDRRAADQPGIGVKVLGRDPPPAPEATMMHCSPSRPPGR